MRRQMSAAVIAGVGKELFNTEILREMLPGIVTEAMRNTIVYTAISFGFGLALGLALALGRISRRRRFRWPAATFIDVIPWLGGSSHSTSKSLLVVVHWIRRSVRGSPMPARHATRSSNTLSSLQGSKWPILEETGPSTTKAQVPVVGQCAPISGGLERF